MDSLQVKISVVFTTKVIKNNNPPVLKLSDQPAGEFINTTLTQQKYENS